MGTISMGPKSTVETLQESSILFNRNFLSGTKSSGPPERGAHTLSPTRMELDV